MLLKCCMDTSHPVEGYFGSEFRTICNHCGVMAAEVTSRWNLLKNFGVFLEKRPRTVKFSKVCSENFYSLTDRRCCFQMSWNLADGKWVKSCVIYRTTTKKFCLPLKLSLLRGSRPKSARASPQQCAHRLHSAPDFIQISWFSAEL